MVCSEKCGFALKSAMESEIRLGDSLFASVEDMKNEDLSEAAMEERMRFYDDDGREVFPNLIAKPSLCVSCAKDDDPREASVCALNRLAQQSEDDFKCGAYVRKPGMGNN